MGKKIRTFAKLLMCIGISACLIAAAYTLHSCYNRNSGFYLLRYATANGGYTRSPYAPSVGATWEAQGNDIYFSIQLAIYFALGAAGCLLWGLPLCWFGRLFEKVEAIESFIIGKQEPKKKDIEPWEDDTLEI